MHRQAQLRFGLGGIARQKASGLLWHLSDAAWLAALTPLFCTARCVGGFQCTSAAHKLQGTNVGQREWRVPTTEVGREPGGWRALCCRTPGRARAPCCACALIWRLLIGLQHCVAAHCVRLLQACLRRALSAAGFSPGAAPPGSTCAAHVTTAESPGSRGRATGARGRAHNKGRERAERPALQLHNNARVTSRSRSWRSDPPACLRHVLSQSPCRRRLAARPPLASRVAPPAGPSRKGGHSAAAAAASTNICPRFSPTGVDRLFDWESVPSSAPAGMGPPSKQHRGKGARSEPSQLLETVRRTLPGKPQLDDRTLEKLKVRSEEGPQGLPHVYPLHACV